MAYLQAVRQALLESMGNGDSMTAEIGSSAMRTADYVARAQILDDLLKLEAKDVADFYGLSEPKEK